MDTVERMNGTSNGRGKPKAVGKGKRATGGAKAGAKRMLEKWAHRAVISLTATSSLLNVWSTMVETKATGGWQWAAMGFGGLIPVGVWLLFQAAAWSYRAGFRRLAMAGVGVGCGLLICSLTHCAHACAGLLGVSTALGWAMAIGIDCGLVWAETAAILVHEEE